MLRYKLRSLLIALAIGPPVLAWCVWPAVRAKYVAWQWRAAVEKAKLVTTHGGGLTSVDKQGEWDAVDFSSGALPMVPVGRESPEDNT